MALMQQYRGNERDFDPLKMKPGQFAVSLDKKYVRMCFGAGVVERIALYDAFEEDMKQIQQILTTCEDIQDAVEAFEKLAELHATTAEKYSIESKSWAVGGTGTREGEDTNNSQYYSQQSKVEADRAKSEADRAAAVVDIDVATVNKAGIVKPDNKSIVVLADGTMKTHFINVIEIPGDADLYNYKNPGFYACYMTATAMTLKNCPTRKAFSMTVGKHSGVYQEIIEYSPDGPKRFVRNYYPGSDVWGPDYRIYTEADPPPATTITNNLLATVPGTALDAVQGEALDGKISELNRKLTYYVKVINVTASVSVSAGSTATVSIPLAVPDGYKAIFGYPAGITGVGAQVFVYSSGLSGGKFNASIRNFYAGDISGGTLSATIICIMDN